MLGGMEANETDMSANRPASAFLDTWKHRDGLGVGRHDSQAPYLGFDIALHHGWRVPFAADRVADGALVLVPGLKSMGQRLDELGGRLLVALLIDDDVREVRVLARDSRRRGLSGEGKQNNK
jgi:hypothetical protein